MLEELTPEEFDEWMAYDSVEPFDNGWLQAGVVSSSVQNCILTALSSFGGKTLQASELSNPCDFVPWLEKPKRGMTPAEYLKHIENQAG